MKRVFVPKLDCFLFADYSSVEYRLLGFYIAKLGDTSIADDFQKGLDPHVETAKAIFDVPKVDEDTRQKGKTFNYSIIYGGGVPTLMRQLGVDSREAKRLLIAYRQARPGISDLSAAISFSLSRKGYIETPWGRRLHPENNHKALNALIQGCAADLMRDALRKTHRYLEQTSRVSHLVTSTHDDMGLDCILDEAPEIATQLPTLMGNADIEKVVPIEIDLSYSETNWGDKEPYVGRT